MEAFSFDSEPLQHWPDETLISEPLSRAKGALWYPEFFLPVIFIDSGKGLR